LVSVIVVPLTGSLSQLRVFVPLMHSSSWFTKSAVVLLAQTSVIGPGLLTSVQPAGTVSSTVYVPGIRPQNEYLPSVPVVVVATVPLLLVSVIVVPLTGSLSQLRVFVPLMHSSSWFTKSAVVLLAQTSVIAPRLRTSVQPAGTVSVTV